MVVVGAARTSSFSIKINLDSLGSFEANSYFLLPQYLLKHSFTVSIFKN